MLLQAVWVIGRSTGGRPTLAHALVDGTASITRCNRDARHWSRRFVPDSVMRWLDAGEDASMCCLTCKRVVAADQIRASRAA
jgi:hypothetical protein